MFKWVEIGIENNKIRYETLSSFMTEAGIPNQVDFITLTPDKLPSSLTELMNQYDGVRVGRGLGEIVVPYFQGNPILVNQIQSADAIIKNKGVWSLRANAVEGLSRVLAKAGERFDFSSAVLIVGTGAAAKVSVAALFRAGFKQFAISSMDTQKVASMIEELQRTMFGAQFRSVPRESLILLPGTHGVLVNTTPMTSDNPLLAELYYFNFFKHGGVAIDFTILPVETHVLSGARDIGAFCIHGYEISVQTDLLWVEQVTGKKISASAYEKSLGEKLREASPKS